MSDGLQGFLGLTMRSTHQDPFQLGRPRKIAVLVAAVFRIGNTAERRGNQIWDAGGSFP
jgi:hypothetical protein